MTNLLKNKLMIQLVMHHWKTLLLIQTFVLFSLILTSFASIFTHPKI